MLEEVVVNFTCIWYPVYRRKYTPDNTVHGKLGICMVGDDIGSFATLAECRQLY